MPDADLDFRGNTVGPAARWLNLGTGAAQLEGLASDRNLFVGGVEDAAHFYLDGKFVTLLDWRRTAGGASALVADPRSRVRRAAPRRC